MQALRIALPLALGCLVASFQSALAQVWKVDDGSQIRFTALQQGSPVQGRFDRFSAKITFDPDDLARSQVEVEIDAASIDTGHKDRDTALRSSFFFDVQHWPSARFTSGRFSHLQGDAYEAHGALTIRDVTRDVVLPFELTIGSDPAAPGRLLATARGALTISRLDYGIGQGEWASTKTVGAPVVIDIEVRASRPR
jgi:polyisoprenoid-binding protein YceI